MTATDGYPHRLALFRLDVTVVAPGPQLCRDPSVLLLAATVRLEHREFTEIFLKERPFLVKVEIISAFPDAKRANGFNLNNQIIFLSFEMEMSRLEGPWGHPKKTWTQIPIEMVRKKKKKTCFPVSSHLKLFFITWDISLQLSIQPMITQDVNVQLVCSGC